MALDERLAMVLLQPVRVVLQFDWRVIFNLLVTFDGAGTFHQESTPWNDSHLPSAHFCLLQYGKSLLNANSPHLYLGIWHATCCQLYAKYWSFSVVRPNLRCNYHDEPDCP